MKNLSALLFWIWLFAHTTALPAQDTNKPDALVQCVERYYGTNDLLVNGRPYLPSNTRASGHPYFGDSDFYQGTLYVKDLKFEAVDIKYDIEKDQLLLRQTLTNGIPVQVVVTPSLVDSFRMGSHLFINTANITDEKSGSFFLKQLYDGSPGFYQKNLKLFYPNYTQVNPFGKFGDAEVSYFLVREGKVHEVKNKKAFLEYFGSQKREVRKFMKQNGIRFKKASDAQFYNLLKYCDELNP